MYQVNCSEIKQWAKDSVSDSKELILIGNSINKMGGRGGRGSQEWILRKSLFMFVACVDKFFGKTECACRKDIEWVCLKDNRVAIWITVRLFFGRVKIQRPELHVWGYSGDF